MQKLKRLLAIGLVGLFAVVSTISSVAAEEEWYPFDGQFEEEAQIGSVGHMFQHGNQVDLEITSDEARSGNSSVFVSGRTVPWGGPGWDVKDYLMQEGWGNWYVDAFAKRVEDEPMTMYFSVYIKLNDGTEDWLTTGNAENVSKDEWTRINAGFSGESAALLRSSGGITPDFDNLEVATLYMCTGEGQLGGFYLDDVRLYRGSDEIEDVDIPDTDFEYFPLDGDFEEELTPGVPGHFFKHGNTAVFSRSEVAYEGEYSLKVEGRDLTFSGAGWDVTGYLRQMGWGDWYFSAYGRSANDSLIGISYSIYMQFTDGSEDWLQVGRQTYLSKDNWTRINVDAMGDPGQLKPVSGSIPNFDNLKHATLYPNTDEGQLGDYYLDKVVLWKVEENDAEDQDDKEDVTRPTATPAIEEDDDDQPSEFPWTILGIGGVVILAGIASVVVLGKRNKNK